MRYFISLGSNLGNKRENLEQAIALLEEKGAKILKRSSLYETSPVGYVKQPWFLNQVVEVEIEFLPEFFLGVVKRIERKVGRYPTVAKGPRIIDIDILMAENTIIKSRRLQIPHPEMEKRNFILVPFMEISPQTVHPVLKRKIKDLKKECQDSSAVHLVEP
jgi:2-amino-4-hydroxy-6-hydroxymethyldihydropteridine diphosphokinase